MYRISDSWRRMQFESGPNLIVYYPGSGIMRIVKYYSGRIEYESPRDITIYYDRVNSNVNPGNHNWLLDDTIEIYQLVGFKWSRIQ